MRGTLWLLAHFVEYYDDTDSGTDKQHYGCYVKRQINVHNYSPPKYAMFWMRKKKLGRIKSSEPVSPMLSAPRCWQQ